MLARRPPASADEAGRDPATVDFGGTVGWITDDGLQENYVVPEFGDSRRGLGIIGGGVPGDEVIGRPGEVARG